MIGPLKLGMARSAELAVSSVVTGNKGCQLFACVSKSKVPVLIGCKRAIAQCQAGSDQLQLVFQAGEDMMLQATTTQLLPSLVAGTLPYIPQSYSKSGQSLTPHSLDVQSTGHTDHLHDLSRRLHPVKNKGLQKLRAVRQRQHTLACTSDVIGTARVSS